MSKADAVEKVVVTNPPNPDLELDIMPVILGEGLRLFERLENMKPTRLEKNSYEISCREEEETMTDKNTDAQEESDFPKISQPALRALNGAGYFKLEHLTRARKTDLSELHGMGPKALGILEPALAENGLVFKAEEV